MKWLGYWLEILAEATVIGAGWALGDKLLKLLWPDRAAAEEIEIPEVEEIDPDALDDDESAA